MQVAPLCDDADGFEMLTDACSDSSRAELAPAGPVEDGSYMSQVGTTAFPNLCNNMTQLLQGQVQLA